MKFNEQQIAQMRIFGMKADATEAEMATFFNGLAAGLQAQLIAMGGAAAGPEEEEEPADEEPAAEPSADFEARVRKIMEADRKLEADRRQGIRDVAAAAKLPKTWADQMIADGETVDKARLAAFSALADRTPAVSGFRVGDDLAVASFGPAITDAILQRAQVSLYELEADGSPVLGDDGRPKLRKAHDRARNFRGLSLMEISRQYLNMLGINTEGMSRPQIAKLMFNRRELQRQAGGILATHSTSDFDNILADTINKTLRAQFIELSPNWNIWARLAFASDFKTISRTQLSGLGTPPVVHEGEEYTYATKSDTKEVYNLAKYGQIFGITWEALINDDLDAFSRVPRSHAASCARLEDNVAYGILTANAALSDTVALFHSTHANLQASGTALSVASLADLETKMRLQTGINSSELLDIMPAFLIVPVGKRVLSQQLISSTVDPAKSNSTPNPFVNGLTVVSNPRLDANSATKWYLAASPQQIDTVEVCFLEGMRQPQFEEEAGFDVDARKYKVRHVVAAKAIDHRGLARNDGA